MMRIAAAILLSATCFPVGMGCYAQDSCSVRQAPTKPGDKPLTASEKVHHILLTTPPWNQLHFAFGDVEAILKCGTQEDAAKFFAWVRNTSVQMVGATVVESDQDVFLVSWDEGFKPNLAAFRFNLDKPLDAIPHPGDKVIIRGTYSSYSREPFQINLSNASFVLVPPRQSKQSMDGELGGQDLGPATDAPQ
jgi:hypothetical protein